jgi:hypothetical protein
MPKREKPLSEDELRLHVTRLVQRNLEQLPAQVALEILEFVRPSILRRQQAESVPRLVDGLDFPEQSEDRTLTIPGFK